MSDTQTYILVDPTAIAAKIEAAGGPQLDPTKPTGTATADGVTLGWTIATGKITVTLLRKPWLLSDGVIWGHINKLLGDPL
jgi:hypothetical protein